MSIHIRCGRFLFEIIENNSELTKLPPRFQQYLVLENDKNIRVIAISESLDDSIIREKEGWSIQTDGIKRQLTYYSRQSGAFSIQYQDNFRSIMLRYDNKEI